MTVANVAPPTLSLLHDCAVRSVRFGYRDDGQRTFAVEVDCPTDLGHPEWDGRRLRLTASEVLLVRGDFWGYTTSGDFLAVWREAVSASTETELARLADMGVRVPPRRFAVEFQGGSAFEVVCGGLTVEVVARS